MYAHSLFSVSYPLLDGDLCVFMEGKVLNHFLRSACAIPGYLFRALRLLHFHTSRFQHLHNTSTSKNNESTPNHDEGYCSIHPFQRLLFNINMIWHKPFIRLFLL